MQSFQKFTQSLGPAFVYGEAGHEKDLLEEAQQINKQKFLHLKYLKKDFKRSTLKSFQKNDGRTDQIN